MRLSIKTSTLHKCVYVSDDKCSCPWMIDWISYEAHSSSIALKVATVDPYERLWIRKQTPGLERWLSGSEYCLFFQRTWVQFPEPILV